MPATVRAEIARRGKAGHALLDIADYATNQGHAIGRDAINRHLRQCVGLTERGSDNDIQTTTVLMASVVAEEAARWPDTQKRIVNRLNGVGLRTEAEIVAGALPDSMRLTLAEVDPDASPAAELLGARVLAKAMRQVLSRRHPEASRDLADTCDSLDATDLADSLRFLAAQAEAQALAVTTP
jgi:hypothetical protein